MRFAGETNYPSSGTNVMRPHKGEKYEIQIEITVSVVISATEGKDRYVDKPLSGK